MSAASATIDPAAIVGASASARLNRWIPADKRRDRRGWIEAKVLIRDKKRQKVNLRLNVVQEILWKKWAERGHTGVRSVVLKARQEGVSTLTLATFFEEVLHVPNTIAVIVDKDAPNASRKMRVIKGMLQNLPQEERPRMSYNSVNEMVFPDLNSSIYIGAAGNKSFGRGDTINLVLLSEFAYYPHPEDTLTGILEAVPRGDGMIVVESTAQGAETYFHQLWRDAEAGLSNFEGTFLPWFIFPEYTEPAAEGDPPIVRTPEELAPPLGGLTDDQIRWRRTTARDQKGKLEQEHPSTAESAFLRSGRGRFDTDALLKARAAAPAPLRTADNGAITVYAEPLEGRTYTIGADTAEGLPDGDFDAAIVVDDRTGVEVATLWGSWQPHVYADKLMELGHLYRDAMLAVERNNHGHAVLQRILLGGEGVKPYPSQRIYRHLDYDEHMKKQMPRPGWPQDQVTKPILTTGLEKLLDEHPECFLDKPTISELLSVVYHKDGSVGAPDGGHDDRFIARGIAEQARVRSIAQTHGGGFKGGLVSGADDRKRTSPLGDTIDPDWKDPRGA